MKEKQEQPGTRLKFFNLSRANSADLFDGRSMHSSVTPDGKQLQAAGDDDNDLFGANCPIRRNLELLGGELVRGRLRSLLELCDHNGLHVPVRQILLLLTNAVLGHPDVKDCLMTPSDIPKDNRGRDGLQGKRL